MTALRCYIQTCDTRTQGFFVILILLFLFLHFRLFLVIVLDSISPLSSIKNPPPPKKNLHSTRRTNPVLSCAPTNLPEPGLASSRPSHQPRRSHGTHNSQGVCHGRLQARLCHDDDGNDDEPARLGRHQEAQGATFSRPRHPSKKDQHSRRHRCLCYGEAGRT